MGVEVRQVSYPSMWWTSSKRVLDERETVVGVGSRQVAKFGVLLL